MTFFPIEQNTYRLEFDAYTVKFVQLCQIVKESYYGKVIFFFFLPKLWRFIVN